MALQLLPTTATFALPFALLNTSLALLCVRGRIATRTHMGTASAKPKDDKPHDNRTSFQTPASALDPLLVATRTHSNFNENVPLALVLAATVELSGGDRGTLRWVLGALLAARVSHALGMFRNIQLFRASGFFGSFFAQLGLGVWGTGLALGWF